MRLALQAVEKPASLGFFDNKRKKDVAAAAALKETGGRNEFRNPLKYASGEKDESGVFDFLDKLRSRAQYESCSSLSGRLT
jgi:hypothetical protein